MQLDLNQLRAFYEGARAGNYTEAARRLHVTQSAVSHAVAKLEASVGKPLVEWRARRMELTPEGELLRRTCERVFRDLAEVEVQLLEHEHPGRRTLRIGATVEFGTTVLIRTLGPLLAAHPELLLDFRFSSSLLQPLLRDEIDLVVDCKLHVHPELERTPLCRERYVVVASPAFLAAQPLTSPLDLARVAVLSLDKAGAWWNPVLLALAEGERPAFRRVVEIDHVRGLIHAALGGMGVGLVPQYAVLHEIAAGTLRVLFPELSLLEDTFAIYLRRLRACGAAQQLVKSYLLGLQAGELGEASGLAEV